MADRDMLPGVAPNAPVIVAGGTVLGTIAGAVTGVTAGVLNSQQIPPGLLGIRLAKSWLVFSFGFFGTC